MKTIICLITLTINVAFSNNGGTLMRDLFADTRGEIAQESDCYGPVKSVIERSFKADGGHALRYRSVKYDRSGRAIETRTYYKEGDRRYGDVLVRRLYDAKGRLSRVEYSGDYDIYTCTITRDERGRPSKVSYLKDGSVYGYRFAYTIYNTPVITNIWHGRSIVDYIITKGLDGSIVNSRPAQGMHTSYEYKYIKNEEGRIMVKICSSVAGRQPVIETYTHHPNNRVSKYRVERYGRQVVTTYYPNGELRSLVELTPQRGGYSDTSATIYTYDEEHPHRITSIVAFSQHTRDTAKTIYNYFSEDHHGNWHSCHVYDSRGKVTIRDREIIYDKE